MDRGYEIGVQGGETVKLVKLPGGWTESSRPAVPCENQLIDDPFKGCRPTPTDSFFLLTCLSRRASIFAGKVASEVIEGDSVPPAFFSTLTASHETSFLSLAAF